MIRPRSPGSSCTCAANGPITSQPVGHVQRFETCALAAPRETWVRQQTSWTDDDIAAALEGADEAVYRPEM